MTVLLPKPVKLFIEMLNKSDFQRMFFFSNLKDKGTFSCTLSGAGHDQELFSPLDQNVVGVSALRTQLIDQVPVFFRAFFSNNDLVQKDQFIQNLLKVSQRHLFSMVRVSSSGFLEIFRKSFPVLLKFETLLFQSNAPVSKDCAK